MKNARRRAFRDALRPDHKAEFIDGAVIYYSPASLQHLLARKHIAQLLTVDAARHDLGLVLDEKALCAFSRNDYEPDVVFFSKSRARDFARDQSEFPVLYTRPASIPRDRSVCPVRNLKGCTRGAHRAPYNGRRRHPTATSQTYWRARKGAHSQL